MMAARGPWSAGTAPELGLSKNCLILILFFLREKKEGRGETQQTVRE